MKGKQMKLENPARLRELDPAVTLVKIGLREGDIFRDIGAGSGIFTIAAAELTRNRVYALELDEGLIAIINEKARAMNLYNVDSRKVTSEDLLMEKDSVDLALLATVLHEIADRSAFIINARDMLKPGGRVAVIEFHKRATSMGPPEALRMAKDEVAEIFKHAGFVQLDGFDLGENYYCLTFFKN